jgi:hypothetical protein
LLGKPCSALGLDCLCSKATKLFTVGNNGNHGNKVGLDCLCTMVIKLFTLGKHGNYGNQVVYGKNDLKALLALGIRDLWISFEPFGRS